MAGTQSAFDAYLAGEAAQSKGRSFPVKAGVLHRLLTKKARCDRLHPNPEDEFCRPDVGPNYKIISSYQEMYLQQIKNAQYYYDGEPVIVERLFPDGYRIINGHRRWAAALRLGQAEIPIRVVNLTHEQDVRRILDNTRHTRRAALDLDEVVFLSDESQAAESPPPFPWNRFYHERIRLGIPALFHELAKNGYDIWLYSSGYYSTDYIQSCFAKYHVRITGVIAAIGKRAGSGGAGRKLEKLITDKYAETLHIDRQSVIRILRPSGEFCDYPLSGADEDWSASVMAVLETLEKNGKGAES